MGPNSNCFKRQEQKQKVQGRNFPKIKTKQTFYNSKKLNNKTHTEIRRKHSSREKSEIQGLWCNRAAHYW